MATTPIAGSVRRWWPTIRVVLSAVMLAFLVHEIHFGDIFPDWHPSILGWIVGGLAFSVAGILLSAVRWHRVLSGIDLPAPLGTLVNTYLASQFVSNFLPSTIGGDVLRVTRLAATNGEPPATFASVVLDRMSGWLILPLLCLTGLAINPSLVHLGRASRAALAISIVTLAALVAVLVVAAHPRLGGRLTGHTSWLRFIGAVHLGMDRLRRHPGAAAEVLVAGLLYQLAMVGAALLASRALGLHVGVTAMLAFVPVVAIVQVLPLTVGGLGVREGAFVLFLEPLHVGRSQAIALGLLVYVLHLIASLLGAPSFAVGNRVTRPAA